MTELEESNIFKELSEDDIAALCEVISPKTIRTYFKDSPKGYQQLNGRVYINKITDRTGNIFTYCIRNFIGGSYHDSVESLL